MNKQSGQIIIIALVFLAIFITISTALLGYTTLNLRGSRQTYGQNRALYLAEAGVDQAIYQLNQNSSYTGETNTALGEGTFTVTVTSLGASNKRITATGYIPNNVNPVYKRTVRVTSNIGSTVIAFRLAMQVGIGGLTMDNGTSILGNVFSNGNISGTGNFNNASGEITGSAIVAASNSPTPDQQWTTQNTDFFFGNVTSKRDAAQSFIPAVSNSLNKISVLLRKIGSPGDINFKIVADNSGSPSKTTLGSGTIAASLVTNNYDFIDGALVSPFNLIVGQKYWIILVTSVDSNNYFSWGLDSSDSYPSGTGKYSPNWSANNPTWNSVGGDFNFGIYLGGTATSLSGVKVGGDATAHIITDCKVTGNAFYQAISSCPVTGTLNPNATDTAPQIMPISGAQVTDWENSAAAGGVIAGPFTISGTGTLGPVKINGDLIIDGTLNLTGNVWVNGNVTVVNGSFINIDPSLGTDGAVIIADTPANQAIGGIMTVNNGVTLQGNGNPGSYVLMISTNSTSGAIELNNNIVGGIYYTDKGNINVSNNVSADRVLGYSVHLKNNAVMTYSSGLQSGSFPGGPGGSWGYVPGSFVIVQ